MKGTVKFFNANKHFGFIAGEDGKEYFAHESGLKEGTIIAENDAVEFDTEQGDKGLKAVNVVKATDAVKTDDTVKETDDTVKETDDTVNE